MSTSHYFIKGVLYKIVCLSFFKSFRSNRAVTFTRIFKIRPLKSVSVDKCTLNSV